MFGDPALPPQPASEPARDQVWGSAVGGRRMLVAQGGGNVVGGCVSQSFILQSSGKWCWVWSVG